MSSLESQQQEIKGNQRDTQSSGCKDQAHSSVQNI